MGETLVSYNHSVTKSGHIHVIQITKKMEEGKEIGVTYHRHVITPGDDFSREPAEIQKIARTVHTPEVIAAYAAFLETVSI